MRMMLVVRCDSSIKITAVLRVPIVLRSGGNMKY